MLFPPRWAAPFHSSQGWAQRTSRPAQRSAFCGLNLLACLPPESDDELLERRAQILADICGLGHGQSSLGTDKGPRQGRLH